MPFVLPEIPFDAEILNPRTEGDKMYLWEGRYFFLFCSVAVFVFGEIYSFLSGAEYLEICIFALLYFLTTVFDPQSFGGKNK